MENQGKETEDSIVRNLCATKLQSILRSFLVRRKILKQIFARYEKIYDPKRHQYYYYDKLHDRSSWIKPLLMLNSDFPEVSPTYTKDQAIIVLQLFFRRIRAVRRVRALYHTVVNVIEDYAQGTKQYLNTKTGIARPNLPGFMGGRFYEFESSQGNKRNDNILSSESEDDSIDSVKVREKRRLRRKYPRSKMQSHVDAAEDNIEGTKELDLSNLGAKHISSRVYDFIGLERLILSYNKLRSISSNIQYLTKLMVLDGSFNQIKRIPSEFEELKLLTTLLLSNNCLQSYPSSIYKLKNLEVLDISYNNFQELPIETGNLELLKELGEWEVSIGLLKNLKILLLNNNNLFEYSQYISHLTRLNELDLSNNKIETIPSNIGQLCNLRKIILHSNNLRELPGEFYRLKSLQECELQMNQLSSFPEYKNISPLDTDSHSLNSEIVDIETNPSEENVMIELRSLDISFNKFELLSIHLASFPRLKFLNASNNCVKMFEDLCFQKLKNLCVLNLSHNKIKELPNSFGDMVSMQECDLSFNSLNDLPLSTMKLMKLKKLNLSYNQFIKLNAKIFNVLYDLEHLEVQHNQVEELSTRAFYVNVIKLVYVDFSNNFISTILEDIGLWKSLQFLDLSNNKLAVIPPTICSCKELQILELHNNILETLPLDIHLLSNLKKFTIHHNKLLLNPNLLVVLPYLKSIDLSWNKFATRSFSSNDSNMINSFDKKSTMKVKQNLYDIRFTVDKLIENCNLSETIHAQCNSCPYFSENQMKYDRKFSFEIDEKHDSPDSSKSNSTTSFSESKSVILISWMHKLRKHFESGINLCSSPNQATNISKLFSGKSTLKQKSSKASKQQLSKSFNSQEELNKYFREMVSLRIEHSAKQRTNFLMSKIQYLQHRSIKDYNNILSNNMFQLVEDPVTYFEPNKISSLYQQNLVCFSAYQEEKLNGTMGNGRDIDASVMNLIEEQFSCGLEFLPIITECCNLIQYLNEYCVNEEIKYLKKSNENKAREAKQSSIGSEKFYVDSKLSNSQRKNQPSFSSNSSLLPSDANEDKKIFSILVGDSQKMIEEVLLKYRDAIVPNVHSTEMTGEIPQMSFPSTFLNYQDKQAIQYFVLGKSYHKYQHANMTFSMDEIECYVGSNDNDPFGEKSMFSLYFELYYMLGKCITLHVEYIQKFIRYLEREYQYVLAEEEYNILFKKNPIFYSQSKYMLQPSSKTLGSRIDFAQRLPYIENKSTPLTNEKSNIQVNQLIENEDLEDIFFDIYEEYKMQSKYEACVPTSIIADSNEAHITTKTKISDHAKRESYGTQKKSFKKEYLNIFFNQQKAMDILKEKTLNITAEEKMEISAADALPSAEEVPRQPKSESVMIGDQVQNSNWPGNNKLILCALKIWINFLCSYKSLLLMWGIESFEICMYILRCRGYDLDKSQWESNIEIVKDGRFPNLTGGERNVSKDFHANFSDFKHPMSPIVIRFLKEQASRCVFYQAKLYQYSSIYPQALSFYQSYLKLSQGKANQDIYMSMLKIHINDGKFIKANETIQFIIKNFVSKKIPLKKLKNMKVDHEGNKIILPQDIIKYDREVAILFQFILFQLNRFEVMGITDLTVKPIRFPLALSNNVHSTNEFFPQTNQKLHVPARENLYGRNLLFSEIENSIAKIEQTKAASESTMDERVLVLDSITAAKRKAENKFK